MPLPILTVSEMRAWEASAWAGGAKEEAVIDQVGRRIADRIRRRLRRGGRRARVLYLAGKGHNGDDVRAAYQHHLAENETRGTVGFPSCLNVLDPVKDLALLWDALDSEPEWVVDGLFGIGLNRPLSAEWLQVFREINESRSRVISVDVPSGLNADEGGTWGGAVRAEETWTVGAPKSGFLSAESWEWVGRVEVLEDVGLGLGPDVKELGWTVPARDFRDWPVRRSVTAHKGTMGHVGIVAGSVGYHGAAVLAARGAMRAMPGLITLSVFREIYGVVGSQLQQVMVWPWAEIPELPKGVDVILAGPGLAGELPDGWRHWLVDSWRGFSGPMVVDASGLEMLPMGKSGAALPGVRVVTPHPGEAARLLRCTVDEVQRDRVAAVREISRSLGGAWVVLKGHQTCVGGQQGPVIVNSSGNPGLAQGGSGDLLAGLIAGLLAQPPYQEDPFRAVRYAVWRHGDSADQLDRKRSVWSVEELAARL